MKKIATILIVSLLFLSCTQDITSSNPSFVAKQNNVFWRANSATIAATSGGGLLFTAMAEYETLLIQTVASTPGTYVFGTTNLGNFVTYNFSNETISDTYTTGVVAGAAYKIDAITNIGTNYSISANALTTGGSGSGLKVAYDEITSTGGIVNPKIIARGSGYVAGDIITVVGGDNNATFKLLNVQESNGELTITSNDNGFITGTFKINAVNNNGVVITFSEGNFFRIPITTIQ